MNTPEHQNNARGSVEENLRIPGKETSIPTTKDMQETLKKKEEKTKKELEQLTKELGEHYKYLKGIGIIPAQANKKIEEEYEITEEETKKGLTHLLVVIPEKKFKDINKIRLDIIERAKKINPNLWMHVMTPVDLWNLGLDGKFDILEALAMSYPLMDKGILGALRVSHVHKSLVLGRFERYVTSYVIAGSMVREEETKTSDIDVFIVIDDTDVKRMPRLELKEKLRGIIYSFIQKAEEIAGVKNKLEPQIYLLTDFWESVKDAHPVTFTFIRDGIPLYDRGAFLPWKSLLRMGKIRPSPEAIDMFMSSGDKIEEIVNKRIFDIAVLDIYWGLITPTQGILMLLGQAPGNIYDTSKSFRETFVKKEKLIEAKYADIFDEIAIKYYKGYEHRKIKPGDITGKDLDRLKKNALEYIKRLKELRLQIERRVGEKDIEHITKALQEQIEITTKKKGTKALETLQQELITTGKLPKKFEENIKQIQKIKEKVRKDKEEQGTTKKKEETNKGFKHKIEVEKAKRYAEEIITALTEYEQRKELEQYNKHAYRIQARDQEAEIYFLKEPYIIQQNNIQKIKGKKLIKSNTEELRKALEETKETTINNKTLHTIEEIFGEYQLTK